jgi:hypothetical protein
MSEPPATAPSAEQGEPFEQPGRLPAWLPAVLATLYDGYAGHDPQAASGWARRLADLLSAPGASLPFSVVHDWQVRTVLPMLAEAGLGEADGLRQLHARAAAGDQVREADWHAALEPALHQLYRHAYGYAEAYASAHASASAYAQANNFSEQGAVSFADSYAATSTDSNRKSFAESNAVANAAVLATAYASGDPQDYAEAYPFALARACAQAWANAAGRTEAQPADQDRLRRLAYTRLAEGLADSCAARIG